MSRKSGAMWWLLTLVAVCAAFLCGIWVARCCYLPHIASLERSAMEAMSIRDQAVASMEVHHNRCYETQAANRELRGAQSLMQEELADTRAQLEELRALQAQRAAGPLTPAADAGARTAMESEARSALKDAKAILDRALREVTEHARICPIRGEIFMSSRGQVWHLRPDCSILINQALDERVYYKCTTCASMEITPNRLHPNTQRTLADDIQMFLAHHGNVLYEARTRNELFLLPWMHGYFGPWLASMREAGLVPEGQG